jgi:hypothetical protein
MDKSQIIEAWIKERHEDAVIIRSTEPLDERRVDVFHCAIPGAGSVWIENGRDSKSGTQFITYEA